MPSRRLVLAGLIAAALPLPLAAVAKAPPPAAGMLNGVALGLVPGSAADQSTVLQQAVDTAASRGLPLLLPGGTYRAGNIRLAPGLRLIGVAGATHLLAVGDAPLLVAEGVDGITIEGLGFDGATGGPRGDRTGLLDFTRCTGLDLDGIEVLRAPGTSLHLEACAGRVSGSGFTGSANVAIFANNSAGLAIVQNRIAGCGNGGILVWRDASGADGTIVSSNSIAHVLAAAGGNGQNGNGINIFRADNVIVSDNQISDCDFSAIRANGTRNAVLRGNICSNCREVAIFSEFGFSGSLVSGNIVDGAAGGISITNLDQGGRLAVVSGNIVRNITPNSPTNPDTTPFGIAAEADTAVTGNTVSAVPGVGISAGYGPYLANVLVADNVVSGADTGIAVSVADGAGAVRVAGNMISGAKVAALAGMRWQEMTSADLAADASRFAHVSIEGNVVSP